MKLLAHQRQAGDLQGDQMAVGQFCQAGVSRDDGGA